MPSRPGCTCQMTDVGEMRWPLKHRCRADRAARRRYCATRPGLSCVLRRHISHIRVLTLGHVPRKKKKHGLSLFLCGACSRTWNGYIHPSQIAFIVFTQTIAEILSARGGQWGVGLRNTPKACSRTRPAQCTSLLDQPRASFSPKSLVKAR